MKQPISALEQNWSPNVAFLAWNPMGERMTTSDTHRRSIDEVVKPASPPSWVILLSSLLVAIGLAWRNSACTARTEARPLADAPATSVQYGGLHGRAAITPSELPGRGWKHILSRVWHDISEHRLLLIAAGVTFYLILAIFPGIAALVSIYGLFVDPRGMVSHLDMVASEAPGGAIDVLRDQLTRLVQQNGTALGVSFVIGLSISLWTATSGVKAIVDALNVVYGEEEKRGFLKLNVSVVLRPQPRRRAVLKRDKPRASGRRGGSAGAR